MWRAGARDVGTKLRQERLVPAVSESAVDMAMAKGIRIYERCKKMNRVVHSACSTGWIHESYVPRATGLSLFLKSKDYVEGIRARFIHLALGILTSLAEGNISALCLSFSYHVPCLTTR
jgi:hypothetical protein